MHSTLQHTSHAQTYFPYEIIEKILLCLKPKDIVSISKTCKAWNDYINNHFLVSIFTSFDQFHLKRSVKLDLNCFANQVKFLKQFPFFEDYEGSNWFEKAQTIKRGNTAEKAAESFFTVFSKRCARFSKREFEKFLSFLQFGISFNKGFFKTAGILHPYSVPLLKWISNPENEKDLETLGLYLSKNDELYSLLFDFIYEKEDIPYLIKVVSKCGLDIFQHDKNSKFYRDIFVYYENANLDYQKISSILEASFPFSLKSESRKSQLELYSCLHTNYHFYRKNREGFEKFNFLKPITTEEKLFYLHEIINYEEWEGKELLIFSYLDKNRLNLNQKVSFLNNKSIMEPLTGDESKNKFLERMLRCESHSLRWVQGELLLINKKSLTQEEISQDALSVSSPIPRKKAKMS